MKNINPHNKDEFNPNIQFDAFTFGIEEGGLRSKSAISTMVCYILSNIDEPLTVEIISSALVQGKIANYFEVCDSIDKLKANGQIIENRDGTLTPTSACKEATSLVEKDLPITVREKSIEICQRVLAKEIFKKENKVTVEKSSDRYKVTMHVSDKDRDFMELSMYVPTESQAQTIKEKFLSNPVRVYENLIGTLFSPEE